MHKTFFTVCILLIYCFTLLTGCGSPQPLQSNTADFTIQYDNEDYVDLNLQLATGRGGFVYNIVSGNTNGCYEILLVGDYSAEITYYDYATMQKVPLTSDIVSSRDETSTAFIENALGGIMPIAINNSLFIVKLGAYEAIENYGEKALPFISKQNKNGTERNTLKLSPLDFIATSSAFAISLNTEELYYVVYDYDIEKLDCTSMSLVKANVEKQTTEKIFSFDIESATKIVGAFKNTLVIEKVVSDAYNKVLLEIFTLNLNTNETCVVAKLIPGETSYAVKTDKFFVLNNTDNSKLQCTDLSTNALQEFDTPVETATNERFLLPEIFDNHIYIQYFDSTGQLIDTYAVDVVGNITSKLRLFFSAKGGKKLVGIYGESEKDFLVYIGDNQKEYRDKSPDGSFFINNRNIMQFALIDKRDYWNNLANYRYFEDNINYDNY